MILNKNETLVFKSLDIDVKEEDKREFSAVITYKKMDRDGEVILPSGVQTNNFENNPILLFSHDFEEPIGSVKIVARDDFSMIATCKVASGTKRSDEVWSLIKQGVLKAVSIGFLKKEVRKPTEKDKKMFGSDVQKVISKCELYELSVVSVPANADTLIFDYKKLEKNDNKGFSEKGKIEKNNNIDIEDIKKDILKEFKILFKKELKKNRGQLY